MIKYSFEQWCLDNNHQDYLDLWDYELNDCEPSDISYKSYKDYYFLCQNRMHDSTSFKINSLSREDKSKRINVKCKICNSIGFYLDSKNLSYLWSKSNTGDEYKIQKSSKTVITLICEHCGREKELTCNQFIKNGLCCQCGDGISYPNKFITNFLSQLNIEFIGEKTFKWSKRKRYDNYIDNLSCIIENHGIQHYEQSNIGRSLKEEQNNDILKKQLAKENGIKHYVELDCRYSKLENIKNSIMSSELPNLLNFKEEDIDWFECERYATKNLIKHICDLWNGGQFETTTELSKHCNLVRSTVLKYLKIGSKFKWCEYDGKEEIDKKIKKLMKRVSMYDNNGNFIGSFESTMDLERKSLELFGVKLLNGSISDVCNHGRIMYKGFIFKYE